MPASEAPSKPSIPETTSSAAETSAAPDPNADPVLAQMAGTWSSNGCFTKYVVGADGTAPASTNKTPPAAVGSTRGSRP
jgi:hypothetical protein